MPWFSVVQPGRRNGKREWYEAPVSLLTREDLVGSLFFPEPRTRPPPPNARDLLLEVDGATLHLRLHGPTDSRLLLLFHGNGEVASDWDDFAPMFTRHVQLAVAEYRGYGRATGTPTMQRLFDDAEKLFDALTGLATSPPLVMGRSLGSAPAWHLAQRRGDRLAGLIIDSGFSDVDAFARRRGLDPATLTAAERRALDPLDKARSVTVPTLLLHGANDTLIPVHEAERLAEVLPAPLRTLEVLPGRGHNDVLFDGAYHRALERFLLR